MDNSIAKWRIILRDIVSTIAIFYVGFDLVSCDYNMDKYLVFVYSITCGLIVFLFKYYSDKKKEKIKMQ